MSCTGMWKTGPLCLHKRLCFVLHSKEFSTHKHSYYVPWVHLLLPSNFRILKNSALHSLKDAIHHYIGDNDKSVLRVTSKGTN